MRFHKTILAFGAGAALAAAIIVPTAASTQSRTLEERVAALEGDDSLDELVAKVDKIVIPAPDEDVDYVIVPGSGAEDSYGGFAGLANGHHSLCYGHEAVALIEGVPGWKVKMRLDIQRYDERNTRETQFINMDIAPWGGVYICLLYTSPSPRD